MSPLSWQPLWSPATSGLPSRCQLSSPAVLDEISAAISEGKKAPFCAWPQPALPISKGCPEMHLPRVCCLCQGVWRARDACPRSKSQHKPAGDLGGTQRVRRGWLALLHGGPSKDPRLELEVTEGPAAPPSTPMGLVPRAGGGPWGRRGAPGAQRLPGGTRVARCMAPCPAFHALLGAVQL